MLKWKANPNRHPTGNELVMIRYRNGLEVGPVPKQSRRWIPWPFGETDWDIDVWAIAE